MDQMPLELLNENCSLLLVLLPSWKEVESAPNVSTTSRLNFFFFRGWLNCCFLEVRNTDWGEGFPGESEYRSEEVELPHLLSRNELVF